MIFVRTLTQYEYRIPITEALSDKMTIEKTDTHIVLKFDAPPATAQKIECGPAPSNTEYIDNGVNYVI